MVEVNPFGEEAGLRMTAYSRDVHGYIYRSQYVADESRCAVATRGPVIELSARSDSWIDCSFYDSGNWGIAPVLPVIFCFFVLKGPVIVDEIVGNPLQKISDGVFPRSTYDIAID